MNHLIIKKSTFINGSALLFFCSIFVFLFVTYPFGDDILQYLYHIEQMQKISDLQEFYHYTNGYDVLFFSILKIFSYVNDKHWYLFFFSVYFIVFLVLIGKMYLQTIYKILIFMILVLFSRLYMDFLFNAIRTEFAALVLLISFFFILNKKYMPALLFVILSGMLHFQMTLFFIGILGLSLAYTFVMTKELNAFLLILSLLSILSKEVSASVFSFFSDILTFFYPKTIYFATIDNTPVSLSLIGQFLFYIFIPTTFIVNKINNKLFLSFIIVSNLFVFILYGAFPIVLRLISVLYPLIIITLVLNMYNTRIRTYLFFMTFLSILTIIYIPFKTFDYTLEPSQEVLKKLEGKY